MSLAIAKQPPRPVLRYYGGKWRLADRLVRLFPPHEVYVEAFGGAASVLMHKPRSHQEIINDLDGEVVNVFRVLQDRTRAKELEQLLRVTPFARAEFELAYQPTTDPIESARRTIVRSFQGFGSDSISRMRAARAGFQTCLMKTGFRLNGWRSNTSAAMDWSHYPDSMNAFTERLQGVTIECRDAFDLIAKCDRSITLHYVDPPYPFSVRAHGRQNCRWEHNYRHEMTDSDHERLAQLLHGAKGMVIISSYPGELYDRLYSDWRQMTWSGQQFCHGAQKRVEAVWLNPAAFERIPQKMLGA